MTNENTARTMFDYNPETPEIDFRCGKSMFSDVVWDFNGFVDSKHLSGARLKFDFNIFKHKPRIMNVIKWYVHNQLIFNKFSTAKRNFDGIKRFIKFIDEYRPEIESFLDVTQDVLIMYYEYLLNDAISETTGKKISGTGIKKAALTIKDILIKGSIRGWEVTDDTIYVQKVYDEMIIHNKRFSKESQLRDTENQEKVSDEKLIDLIVRTAFKDLEENKNILVASAIIITTQIGLRIHEVLPLESGCLKKIDGDMMVNTSTTKLTAEEIEILKPANELVIFAINKLEEYSKPLREESGMSYLFLNRSRNKKGQPVVPVSHSNWNKNYVRPWLEMHDFRDSEGDIINFTSHTFRHAFATYALKGGASIDVISEIMNHKSIRGTTYYTHLIEEDVKNRFGEVLSENSVIAGKKSLQIKNKLKELRPFAGKTVAQVDKLRKAMKIQVLPHGLCMHHPMRNEPCLGDGVCLGCSNFITTPEYLDIHKERLANVQKELKNAPSEGPFESKLKHMEKYLIEIIEDLEKQLNYQGKQNNANYK